MSTFFGGSLDFSSQSLFFDPTAPTVSFQGLGTGLNTTQIVNALLALNTVPIQALTLQQERAQARQGELQALQSQLQGVTSDATNLGSALLFSTGQSATSSNSGLVTATISGNGAPIGAYQVNVTQLASAAQRTFTYTAPQADDSLTIDGQQLDVAAGTSLSALIKQINSDSDLDVYAAQGASADSLVLYQRTTGRQAGGYISVQGGSVAEQGALASAGQDAQYSINGGATQSSPTDSVTGAIAGVTLNLLGTTPSPVTIHVGAPAPNPNAVTAAVTQFVNDYNAAVTALQTQLNQKPVSNPVNQEQAGVGTLYHAPDLMALLNTMRQVMYKSGDGLGQGMASLADIGITTGAPSGGATPSQSAINGLLTVDQTKLTDAINSNPNGVKLLLRAFSASFQAVVNPVAGPGGTMSIRINSDGTQISQLRTQLHGLQQTLVARQTALQKQFTDMTTAIQRSQAQSSWLTAQISAMSSRTTRS